MRPPVFNPLRVLVCFLTLALFSAPRPAAAATPDDLLAWPQITQQNRPWTRWWWMGSAVDKENLTDLLHQYHDAGVGGVEICPIYGAVGYEKRYVPYLSPQWMDALNVTTRAAHDLDMGVDMTTGTGWPMGGPDITTQDASATVLLHRYAVNANAELKVNLTGGQVQTVYAISDAGDQVDLTSSVKDNALDWTAPAGSWRVYAVTLRSPAMKVKRAAPGGEGSVIDPFSTKSMDDYLARFDAAFANYKGLLPRAQFHDSYEYVGNWTRDLFDQFQARRNYDLRGQLPALMGEGTPDAVARVLCDYRQTMAELHMDYLSHWVAWCHAHGMLAREQAHGAPANLLDLYALADIPETETFGPVALDQNVPMNKFASSAAHVTGKQLTSSESFTWLGEHFQVSLAQVKPVADYLFLCGINHMFFHGMAYSPKDVPWPGWLFYAAVDFNPNGGLWHDLPAFNSYVARCQSILQTGKPSNDVLLYFPVYDLWQTARGTLIPFNIAGQWLRGNPFYPLALSLESAGYAVDYVSDTQLASATCANGVVTLGGNTYLAIVLPHCQFMPAATMANLVRLTKAGAVVVAQDSLPNDVPGLGNLALNRAQLQNSLAQINIPPADPARSTQGAPVGSGYFWVGKDPITMLKVVNINPEPMVAQGLRYIRRTSEQGYNYFVVNRGQQLLDGWVTISAPAKSAVLRDPMNPDRVGIAALRYDRAGRAQVYLQLQPGESRFVQTFTNQVIAGQPWPYWQTADEPIDVTGAWKVHFLQGGPVLPKDFETQDLASWTQLGDDNAKTFAGTAVYSIDFDAPVAARVAQDWLLDLGKVCESARVRVNGQDVGTVFSAPFQIHLASLLHPGINHLEFEVTNLAANRIADLDRRGVNWKSFHEINFVGRDYQPFDASDWPLRDSGLLGPVRLTPLLPLAPGQIKQPIN